jgi:hypothetical protein
VAKEIELDREAVNAEVDASLGWMIIDSGFGGSRWRSCFNGLGQARARSSRRISHDNFTPFQNVLVQQKNSRSWVFYHSRP